MFKRVFWLSIFLAVSAFAGQVVITSGVLAREDIAVVGESTWDKLANAASQTSQEIWNSAKSMAKSASFLLPDAVVQSLSSELPTHDATVGSTPGEAGVSGGSASYSIPIALPPGRKGMQPNISLNYSSKSGNGIAGMGWNVSGLSSIHRCPMTLEQDGQARAVDYSMNDRLCFDGQRLVATSGTYGALNTKYATEIDSFARITQLGGDLNAVNSYFKVEYKSGEIAYFGGTSTTANNARSIAGGVTKPLNWLIARTEDRLGNNIVYTYTSFGNGEYQPAAIFYTGFNTTQGDRKVEFVYETRPSTNGANDQSSSYLAGGLTRQTQRLTTIKTWVGTEAVREYRLNYGAAVSTTTGRSLLRSVQECALLSGVATCRPPTTFAWQEGQAKYAIQSYPVLADLGVKRLDPVGDLDGDGARDFYAAIYDASGAMVGRRLLSFGANRAVKWSMESPYSFRAVDDNQSVDFDMDGKSDLVMVINGQVVVNFWRGPANATSFTTAFTASWNTGVPTSNSRVYIQDLDSDGRSDILVYETVTTPTNSCYVKLAIYKNNVGAAPGGSGGFTKIANPCLSGSVLPGTSLWDGEKILRVSDFDGDALPDIWMTSDASDGSGSRPVRILFGRRNPAYSLASSSFSSLFPSADPQTTAENNINTPRYWMDVNGDGLTDMVYPLTTWRIRLNTGGKFGNRITLTSNKGIEFSETDIATGVTTYRYQGIISQADSDNDGREEILIPRRFAARVCITHFPEPGDPGTEPQVVSPGGTSASRVSVASASASTGYKYETWIACPEDPVTGTLDATGAALISAVPGQSFDTNNDGVVTVADTNDLGEATGPVLGMYTYKFPVDQSRYYMNALKFVETAPGQFGVIEEPTGLISGADPVDVYGDGFEDAQVSFQCDYSDRSQCLLMVGDGAYATAFPGNWKGFLSPQFPIKNGGQHLISENIGPDGLKNGDNLTPKTTDTLASVTDGMGNQTQWSYYPLSTLANRTAPGDTPLYSLPSDPTQRYVDERHTYFTSSMQVVSRDDSKAMAWATTSTPRVTAIPKRCTTHRAVASRASAKSSKKI